MAAVWWVLMWGFVADDAFIVARYAAHIAAGEGWTFNPGEPVSALTSPLHGMLMAAAHALTSDGLATTRLLGVALVAGVSGWAILGAPRRWRATVAAMTLPSPFLALWVAGGLETPLLFALVGALTLVALQAGEAPSPRRLMVMGLLGALCALTRYDSVLFCGPVVAWGAWRAARARPVAALALLPGVMLGLGWLGYAWGAFGDIFPTSLYRKPPGGYWLGQNTAYTAIFLCVSGAGLGVPVFLARLVTRRRIEEGWLTVALLPMLAYGCLAATVHMMFGFRLFLPYLIPLALWAARHAALAGGAMIWGLLALHGLSGWGIWSQGLNPIPVGEYQRLSARDFAETVLPVLKAPAEDIRAHWAAQGSGRPPRVFTFAAGALPMALPEAYIFEDLVSYRRHCPRVDLKPYADYVLIHVPIHGPRAAQIPAGWLPRGPLKTWSFPFDDHQSTSLELWFNPDPKPNPLPPRVDGPCPVVSAEEVRR